MDSEGNRFLDRKEGLCCAVPGFCNEKIARAVAKPPQRLTFYNTCRDTTQPTVMNLSAEIIPPPPTIRHAGAEELNKKTTLTLDLTLAKLRKSGLMARNGRRKVT